MPLMRRFFRRQVNNWSRGCFAFCVSVDEVRRGVHLDRKDTSVDEVEE